MLYPQIISHCIDDDRMIFDNETMFRCSVGDLVITCAPLVQEWVDGTTQKANSERVVIQATEQEHAGAAQLLHHALQTLQNA